MALIRRTALTVARGLLAWSVPSALYLGLLAWLSRGRRKREPAATAARIRVLIPAHDEEAVIGACLNAVGAFDPPAHEVVVIADNCTDGTADVARRCGARVIERHDPQRPGKGPALQWALRQPGILADADGTLFLDADTLPEPGVLSAGVERLDDGADIVQVALISRGEHNDDRSAMNWWTTTLMGRVRPRGLNRIGLPARLQGAGMLFRNEVLAHNGWPTTGISEDFFATVHFVDLGYTILATDDAIVWARAPETDQAARSQRLRWESGKILAMRGLPGLARTAIRRRSPAHAALAVHVATPPTTVHAVALGAGTVLAWFAGRQGRRDRWLGAAGSVALAVYLAEGLRLIDDRSVARRAATAGPRFVRWKLGLQIEAIRKHRSLTWERTSRDGMSTSGTS